MSNVVEVLVFHTELVDPERNHDKFYRCYVLPNGIEVRQYGRNGTAGAFQIKDHGEQGWGEDSARKQIDAKERKGYDRHTRFTFFYDLDRWRGDGRDLYNVSLASRGEAGTGAVFRPYRDLDTRQEPEAPEKIGLDDFNDRALRAITMSVTDQDKAMVEFAQLQGDWSELEAQVEAARSYLDTLEQLVAGG